MSIIISGVGRIGKDAVVRHSQDGTAVVGFSLAMDDGFGDKKTTLWFDCSGWGKRYEAVAPYLLKGSQVFVNGTLGEREHEGKTYKTVRLSEMDLVGGKPADRQEGGTSSARQAPKVERRDEATGDSFVEDDIPFITNRGQF